MSIAPDPLLGEWFQTKHGKYLITKAYLRGAKDAQSGAKMAYRNPYAPGEELAQYQYGFSNELHGHHDAIDLPFEKLIDVPAKDSTDG